MEHNISYEEEKVITFLCVHRFMERGSGRVCEYTSLTDFCSIHKFTVDIYNKWNFWKRKMFAVNLWKDPVGREEM